MKVLAACLRMRGQLVGQVEVCGGGEGREGVNLEARNQQSKLPRKYLDYLHACPMESLCSQCSSQD